MMLLSLPLYLSRHSTNSPCNSTLLFKFLSLRVFLFLSFLFLSCKFHPLGLFLCIILPSPSPFISLSLCLDSFPSLSQLLLVQTLISLSLTNNLSLIILRDWFMRLCGLMLDLLFIAALSKAYPKPKNLEQTHYVICSGFVLVCFVWNILCFFFIAKKVFPNFWFERGLVLAADCLGHSYTGTCVCECECLYLCVCVCVYACVCVCV